MTLWIFFNDNWLCYKLQTHQFPKTETRTKFKCFIVVFTIVRSHHFIVMLFFGVVIRSRRIFYLHLLKFVISAIIRFTYSVRWTPMFTGYRGKSKLKINLHSLSYTFSKFSSDRYYYTAIDSGPPRFQFPYYIFRYTDRPMTVLLHLPATAITKYAHT